MSKTLFFTIDFPPLGGGMSRHSLDVVLGLSYTKEPVIILAPQVGGDKRLDDDVGLAVVRLRGIKSGEIFNNYLRSVIIFFLYGFSYCLTRRVKAILANTWSIAGVAAFLIKKTLGIPYFVFAYGLDIYSVQANTKAAQLMRIVLRNASTVIAISNFTAHLVKSVIGEQGRIVVLNPIVDIKRFIAQACFSDKKVEGKKVILTVARLVESKNHETLIRAFAKVVKSIPEAVYRIIGEGPMESQLKELVNTLGLVDKVIFVGNVPDSELAGYYYSCAVFVMVSQEIKERGEVEGFGIVFLEAAACAKPVIGSKSGGIPDAVIDGVTGILVNPLNEDEIARAIVCVLQDEQLAKSLGENGRKRVESELTLENFGEKLKRIINETVMPCLQRGSREDENPP